MLRTVLTDAYADCPSRWPSAQQHHTIYTHCGVAGPLATADLLLPCAQPLGGAVLGDGSSLVNPAVKRVVADPAAVDPALHAKARTQGSEQHQVWHKDGCL